MYILGRIVNRAFARSVAARWRVALRGSALHKESQASMVELQALLNTKQTLDAEIAIYRKMLEVKENRVDLWNRMEQVKTHKTPVTGWSMQLQMIIVDLR